MEKGGEKHLQPKEVTCGNRGEGEEDEEHVGPFVPLEISLNCLFYEDGNPSPGYPTDAEDSQRTGKKTGVGAG